MLLCLFLLYLPCSEGGKPVYFLLGAVRMMRSENASRGGDANRSHLFVRAVDALYENEKHRREFRGYSSNRDSSTECRHDFLCILPLVCILASLLVEKLLATRRVLASRSSNKLST